MKISRITSFVSLSVVLLAAPMVNAEAVNLSDQQIRVIKANCLSAQNSIQQLQRTEAATRVNRGRAYESISTLFVALNSRAALNKLDVPVLTAATSAMERRFSAFKDDYSAYEEALTTTTKLSCANQPVSFYDSLTNAREQRAKVAADIKSINEILNAYQQGVNDLRASIVQTESAQ